MSTPTKPQVECEQHHRGLYVSDVIAAADFYTNKLGMELRSDEPLAPGSPNRWIAVALYALVALMWLVPDRRIEARLRAAPPHPAAGE